MYVMIFVYLVHAPGIEEDQYDKDVDRALLGEPETKLEAANTNSIELVNQQYAEHVRTNKPDGKANPDKSKIAPPIC